jgi:hypothetical protein
MQDAIDSDMDRNRRPLDLACAALAIVPEGEATVASRTTEWEKRRGRKILMAVSEMVPGPA